MKDLFVRLRALFTGERLDRRLDEEIASHLALLARDYERDGMTAEQARHAARRTFGGVEQMKEAYRDRRSLPWIEDVRRDVLHALRAMRRAPIFAVSAVLTLALGMCAMTGMLTIMNAFMFRPLPVRAAERLISIGTVEKAFRIPQGVSYPDLQEFRSMNLVVEDAMGYFPRPAALNLGRGAERIGLELVTGNYFTMLGIDAGLGRLIQPPEGSVRGDAPVIVLTHKYWQARFGADATVVGRRVRLNGRPFTIVGVTPASFPGTESFLRIDAYVPVSMFGDLVDSSASILDNRIARALFVLARLKPGVSLAQARAALDAKAVQLAREHPSTNRDIELVVVPELHARPNPSMAPVFRIAATGMAGLALVLLLIVGANVANLLLARAAGRGREVALRVALGAKQGRLVRQFLTESIVLAMLGAAVAVPIVLLALQAFRDFIARTLTIVRIDPDLTLDPRVVLWTCGVAALTGIVAGLAPALFARRTNAGEWLKAGARGAIGSGGGIRRALVVAQVALSLALLVSGGLFARSLDRARAVDLGLARDGLLVATAAPGMQGHDAVQRYAFYTAVHDRIARIPNVDSAAWISLLPFELIVNMQEVAPAEQPLPPGERVPLIRTAAVSTEYFATSGVRLREGRLFEMRDGRDAPRVAIVNQTVANRFWPGRSAIGHRITINRVTAEVVGVVANGKYTNVWEAPQGMVFSPLAQDVPGTATLVVRSSLPPAQLTGLVRDSISGVDPDVAVYSVKTMSEHLDSGTAFLLFRLGALVANLFGVMGILLASIGLYGTIAYHVALRTQEIGVRMTLGARALDVVRGVVAHGARLATLGVAIGIVLAFGVARTLGSLLVGVSPFDPLTYGLVAVLLVAVCLLASFIPARRATRVDPMAALRAE